MVELMKIMLTSFRHYPFSAPDPAAGHFRPTPLPEILGHTGKSGSVSYGVNAPFSWVLLILFTSQVDSMLSFSLLS